MKTRSKFEVKKTLSNPHWQTMWPTFIMRRKASLNTHRERLELSDGDFIDLEWYLFQSKEYRHNQSPIIILLHGITGHINSPYIKYLMPILAEHGWRPVMMYYRGYSGDRNRSDVMTHAGKTDDFTEVVNILHQRETNTPLAALGFSQGANMLLKYLGERGHNVPLSAAVAISPPFQLRSIANRIRHGISRFYQWYLMRDLKKFYRQKFQYDASPIDAQEIKKCRSFWQFDDNVTAPINGFKGAVDYYRQASCFNYLPKIRIPTLIIHAKDDPFMMPDVIPDQTQLSDSTLLEISEHGGHLGFVNGTLFSPRFWLAERIPEFFIDRGFVSTF